MNQQQLEDALNKMLMSTESVSKAAILRKKDGQVRIQTPTFAMSKEEFNTIKAAFESPRVGRDNPIVLDGSKYLAVRVDKQAIYAKDAIVSCVCILFLLGERECLE
eukprot:m.7581 g.7581  ORF g.7581 m.7581 type:complete len:106 (+) comp5836_c0_seq3:115-432(+)